uniref:Ras-like protein Rab7 n=1 Tax=Ganoderma boninense TaxID=34458 RepID=A0A5K1K3C2_9APHY|nr:Ras-like protein Rab7 [Ganoderma boninense]
MGMGGGRVQNARPAVLPRTEDGDSSMAQNPGELPVIQDLTPQVPIQDVSPHNTGEGFRQQEQLQRPQQQPQLGGPMEGVASMGEMNGGPPPNPYFSGPSADGHAQSRPYNANGRGGGRGRGRGTFGGDAQSFRPTQKRDDKTLVVEKIPEDKLSLGAVNDWFGKFGTVTNVAVDAASGKALVSFTNHEDAHRAWKSEEAVFGNRFVKVFWHRPMEGHGQVGQRMLAASANIVAQRASGSSAAPPSTTAHEGSPAPQTPSAPAPPAARNGSAPSSAAAALAAKQKLLEQQIAEQKTLMSKLSSASPEEKKEIMARLRKLGEEMKPSSTPAALSSSQSHPAGSVSASQKRAVSTSRTEDQERAERERLDKELDLHHVEGDGEEESTEELRSSKLR